MALIAPTFWMLLLIMALFQWISITFYMRTEMYREKTREYCLAAKSYGASHLRIIFRHLLPNCLTPLVTFTPFAVVAAIFALTLGAVIQSGALSHLVGAVLPFAAGVTSLMGAFWVFIALAAVLLVLVWGVAVLLAVLRSRSNPESSAPPAN